MCAIVGAVNPKLAGYVSPLEGTRFECEQGDEALSCYRQRDNILAHPELECAQKPKEGSSWLTVATRH